MMVNLERTGPRDGLTTNRGDPGWIRPLGAAGQALAAMAGFGALYSAWNIAGSPAHAIEYTMFGLAAISGAAALAARWAQGALAERLKMLSLALDGAPDAQMIVAADGRFAYANPAFDTLFPGRGEPSFDRIERSLAEDPESVTEFRQLRRRIAAGVRATVTVSRCQARSGAGDRFIISASPITGRPGYCFLNIHDITARHEIETTIRDERDRLIDFFDHAPIGFYSVDGNGGFRFVKRGGSARFHRFVAGRRSATFRSLWRSRRWDTTRRGIAQNSPRPRRRGLDRPERRRLGSRAAHALRRMRLDTGARVESRPQIGTSLPALFRQCADR